MNTIFLKKINILLYFTIIMFLLGDVLRKVAIYLNLEFIRYTGLSKTIVILTYLVFIIFWIRNYIEIKVTKKFIYLFTILIVVFFCGQFILKSSPSLLQSVNGNILFFSRFLYWPLTLIIFFPLITSKNYSNTHLNFFINLFFINIGLIALGFFFEINLFKTYNNESRFGFMGIYNTSNQVSYYFILFILYYYYRVFFKSENILLFSIVLITSLFIGTKKVYFFLIILFIYHFFKFKLYKERNFYAVFLILVTLLFSFFSNLKALFASKFSIFIDLYYESGLMTSLTSFRNQLLIKAFDYILNVWRIPNYILGGPNFNEIRSEFGLFDLYVFFGLFGLYAYYFYFKAYYQATSFDKFYLFILISIGITAFLSSGFLSDANQPLVFVLISGYFIVENKYKLN